MYRDIDCVQVIKLNLIDKGEDFTKVCLVYKPNHMPTSQCGPHDVLCSSIISQSVCTNCLLTVATHSGFCVRTKDSDSLVHRERRGGGLC